MKRWAGAWAISRQVGYPGAQLWRGLFPPNRPPSNRAKPSAEGQVLMASVQVGASGTQLGPGREARAKFLKVHRSQVFG